ncbi:Sugar diacid regulator [uncultured Roseburia sp.]|uniref:Helix-turn-helix domain-containing protein n=1 Tax=Brotonthovivens ammoniilytica TaxID=2981725 RepID=A0ABT2TPG8_9FIRM|nr:helix-turn-helix domain-containing protein [Brotonthovivens ammoniilytica]MCU6763676.1 helix-turn-helix domain-containing protein [Brotonthovivens ammoniilytica]SCJ30270.1 Sugar diacid regulator [uncultured Roseburia sp.]
MNTELLAEKLQNVLEEMKEISHTDYYLFLPDGVLQGGTKEELAAEITAEVCSFISSPAQRQFAYGYHFVKIMSCDRMIYILLVNAGNQDEYSNMLVQMAASQIKNIDMMANVPMDEQQYLRQILMGNLKEDELETEAEHLKLEEHPRSLFVLEFEEEKNAIAMEMLKNLFVQEREDYLIDMNACRAVLMKGSEFSKEEAARELSEMIIDNMQTEALLNVRVGISGEADSIRRLEKGYQEACMALKISRIFEPKNQIVMYGHLGIGRLIYQLPVELCQMFLREVFGEHKQIDLDEEMLVTIERLFENNLNISETARQLYVHRNTLVYRLERLEKLIGLDIRTFEDAMMFRIAMMVQAHIRNLKKKE